MRCGKWYIVTFLLAMALRSGAVEGEKKVWQEATSGLHYEGEVADRKAGKKKEGIDIPEDRGAPPTDSRRTERDRGRTITPFKPELSAPEWTRIVAYILIGSAVLFLIYLILRALDPDFRFVRNKKIDSQHRVLYHDPDSLEDAELDHALQQAFAGNDLRLAVRIRFLDALKNLEERNIIKWKKSKTNRQYLMEARQKMGIDDLKMLILFYEEVWFGSLLINQKMFDLFDQLVQKVSGNHEK